MMYRTPQQTPLGVGVSNDSTDRAGNLIMDAAGSPRQRALNNVFETCSTVITNEIESKIYKPSKCNNVSCKLCTCFTENETFNSTVTGKRYYVVYEETEVSCNSVNVIYLLTCEYCKLQYTGETIQKCNARISKHRDTCKNRGCKNLSNHFRTGSLCLSLIHI